VPEPATFRNSIRLILLVGFGGLLALMAFAGLSTMGVLRAIENDNNAIRQDFLARNRTLNEIRSSLYLSGTYLRDYLLDPDIRQAESHRATLERTRAAMDQALAEYGRHLRPDEAQPFHGLEHDLDEYWRTLSPVLSWTPAERLARGDLFLRSEVYPRRASMIAVADQIASVNERQLNAGDRRVSELFHQFRQRVSLTLLVTIGLGLLLAAVSISYILRLEREARNRFAEIERARTELRELSGRLVETQEQERRALSRELHDEVGQTLSAVVVEISNFSAALPPPVSPALRAHVDGMKKLVEGTMGVVRNMALLLRPSMLDDIGLVPALRWQAREVSRRSGMRVDIVTETIPDNLPDEHKTCVYRVVQEALHNCARHSQAHVCRITLGYQNGDLLLGVQDDGTGFDRTEERGMGLLGMQERVERLGGRFEVNSAAGKGTLLTVSLPLARPAIEMSC
jgi:signal transduction histidine kinase